MGCGVSRPITDERTAPVSGGFRPIRRKLEEIKRMRGGNTITGSSPSKKELLEGDRIQVEDDDADDDQSHTSPKSIIHDHTQKNNTQDGVLSSMPEKEGSRISIFDNTTTKPLPAPAPAPAPKEKDGSRISICDNTTKPLPAPTPKEKEKDGNRLSISDNTTKALLAPTPKEKEKENDGNRLSISDNTMKPLPTPEPTPIVTSGEKRTEARVEKGGGGGENEEEEDEEENEYGYIDGPSSPSFREYYVPSIGNSMELTDTSKEEEDANGGGKKEKKTRRSESNASSEESVTQLVNKRSSKGRRFRRVLPKGLNVRSCYTPPCTSSHDDPQKLLNAKVVHAS